MKKELYDKVMGELAGIQEVENDIFTDRKTIVRALKMAQVVLFPEFYHVTGVKKEEALYLLYDILEKAIGRVLAYIKDERNSEEVTDAFIGQLPELRRMLLKDAQAIYEGDPAAISMVEVFLSYPGFYAILIHRIAHVLYTLRVPFLARIMSEYAHEKTGIDIHPGATIGERFCIDHGTGIVIGETALIGHYVKIYQGVTIGAKSFELDADGNPVKGGKRHPDIGDHVIIYANATILGGDTKVGNGSVIGGNVWLVHSVPENSRIVYQG